MKYITILALAVMSIGTYAQKIKVSEYDKFIKAYRIEAERVVFKMNLGGFFIVKIRSVDSTIFIGVDEANYITDGVGEGQDLIFLLDNDSTINVHAKQSQIGRKLESGYRIANLEYYTSIADLNQIRRSTIKSIRIYGLSGYKDIDIKEGDAKDMSHMCEIFIEEFTKKMVPKS